MLKAGWNVVFVNHCCVDCMFIYDCGVMVGKIENLPQNLSVPLWTAHAFVQKEAIKYGLIATPQRFAPYMFKLS